MDKKKYLERIEYTDIIEISDDVLTSLHKQHIYQIPFENLDIYYKRLFDLSISKIYQKVIINRRGGFCYELNLLFSWLLNEIGFKSRIISSQIYDEQDCIGPEFDHMSVYVQTERAYLVDVGYGDLFIIPLEIILNQITRVVFFRYGKQVKELTLPASSKSFSTIA